MADQDANDINQMMSVQNEGSTQVPKKKSKFLWVVLACVVMGVGLGVVVYQQTLKTVTKPTVTPKPSVTAVKPSLVPLESPTTPTVSLVEAEPNTVSFPKAGKLRMYYYNGIWTPLGVILNIPGGGDSFIIPSGTPTTPMKIVDTGYELTGPVTGTLTSYWGTSSSQLSIGWIKPVNNNCGANGFGLLDISSHLAWATEQAMGEPIVSVQCWGDYSPNPNDTSAKDFNDFLIIWSYTPASAVTSPSPSPVASVKASASPSLKPSASPSVKPSASVSPSPSAKASVIPSPSPSPSPVASVKASASPSLKPSASPSVKPSASVSPSPSAKASVIAAASIAPSPSPRVVMPDTSEGTPVTGIFEVTMGTLGVGLLLLILGLLGLLVI